VIRPATLADIPRLVEMGRENYRDMGGDAADYDPAAAARFASEFIMPSGAVFLSDGGMIGGVLCPRWQAPGVVEAVEMMWWAGDGSGFRLLRRFCEWAQENGAQPVITTGQDIPARVLSRYGLRRSETILRGN